MQTDETRHLSDIVQSAVAEIVAIPHNNSGHTEWHKSRSPFTKITSKTSNAWRTGRRETNFFNEKKLKKNNSDRTTKLQSWQITNETKAQNNYKSKLQRNSNATKSTRLTTCQSRNGHVSSGDGPQSQRQIK